MRYVLVVCSLIFVLSSCKEETLPKPKSFLTLEYQNPVYKKIENSCNYQFEVSNFAQLKTSDNCWAKLQYPDLKATVHITYRAVDNNLDEILREVEKLTFEHTIKADAINAIPFENYERQVFGKLYNVEGDVATNVQFRVTDSVNHVLSGALYFYSRPNYDSIVPAVRYLEKDIMHIIETLEWKNNE